MFYIEDEKADLNFKDDVDDSIWNNIESVLSEYLDDSVDKLLSDVGFRPYSSNNITVSGIKLNLSENQYEYCLS